VFSEPKESGCNYGRNIPLKYFREDTNMITENFILFIQTLTQQAEQETVDYVLEGMRETFGAQTPDAEVVEAYLKNPENSTALTTKEQLIATHKLLEIAEINFRTTCDLIRYQMFRKAGIANSVDEFLELLHSGGKR